MIKVSIDGGVHWQEVQDVRIEAPDSEDQGSTLTLMLNHEGMVKDVWSKKPPEECLATQCMLWDDMWPEDV